MTFIFSTMVQIDWASFGINFISVLFGLMTLLMTLCIMSENIFDQPIFGTKPTEAGQREPFIIISAEFASN